jgi:hypothetical protein
LVEESCGHHHLRPVVTKPCQTKSSRAKARWAIF